MLPLNKFYSTTATHETKPTCFNGITKVSISSCKERLCRHVLIQSWNPFYSQEKVFMVILTKLLFLNVQLSFVLLIFSVYV